MTGFSDPQQIGITINDDGDIVFPFLADQTGSWVIAFDDGSADTFLATSGEYLTKINDFAEDTDIIFQIRRPDNTIFNETAYIVNYTTDTITTDDKVISIAGKKKFTVTTETAGYTHPDLKGVKVYYLTVDNETEGLGESFDSAAGAFTWTLSAGQKVTILYFK